MYLGKPWQSSRRPGKVAVLVALCLTGVLGFVAIVADGGMLLDQRRRAQAAADAAALAAAGDLFERAVSNAGVDVNGTALARARAVAAAQGYANDGKRSIVEVNIPPKSGDHVGKAGYVEVIISFNQPRGFSRIFASKDLPVKARAVARGLWTTINNGIIVLELTESESLKANGGGTISVKNADIVVNSRDESAVGGDGTGTIVRVINGAFQLSGGVKANTTLDGPVNYNQKPTPDPLAYLPQPTLPTTVNRATKVAPNSLTAAPFLKTLGLTHRDVTQMYILEPGRYDSLPNFTNGDVVILKQASANSEKGIYYLNDTGFTSTGARIIMDPTGETTGGLMFYNDPKKTSSGINITGGQVLLEPLSSSAYRGISIFQNRTADVPLQITGQGGMSIRGTFYAANAAIKITGSNTSALDVIGSQYISRTLQSGGNGSYTVDWLADKTARTRLIGLVE